jgi:hypothetical protein
VSRESTLARGRAFLTGSLVDACTIQHPTGSSTNLTTGDVTPTYATVYTGPCKIQGGMSASGRDVAEAHLAVLSPFVHVPIAVTGVVEGDVVTITASAHDAELVGRVLRVDGPDHKSFATARRLQCTEVTS